MRRVKISFIDSAVVILLKRRKTCQKCGLESGLKGDKKNGL
jgi:hypothetical protein